MRLAALRTLAAIGAITLIYVALRLPWSPVAPFLAQLPEPYSHLESIQEAFEQQPLAARFSDIKHQLEDGRRRNELIDPTSHSHTFSIKREFIPKGIPFDVRSGTLLVDELGVPKAFWISGSRSAIYVPDVEARPAG